MNFVLGRRTSTPANTESASVMPSIFRSDRSSASLLPFPLSWPFRGHAGSEDASKNSGRTSSPRGDDSDDGDSDDDDSGGHSHSLRHRRRASLQREPRTPRILGRSAILREDLSDARAVSAYLPLRYAAHDWELVYSTMRDGTSLQTLYAKVSGAYPVMILIRDGRGHTFGCFTPTAWKVSTRYEGTGESFAFTLNPKLDVYKWSRRNSYFQLASASSLALGGGGAFALFVDSMLERGSSGPCATFDSPCLASSEQFDVVVLEAFRIVPPHLHRPACHSPCIPVRATNSTKPQEHSFSCWFMGPALKTCFALLCSCQFFFLRLFLF